MTYALSIGLLPEVFMSKPTPLQKHVMFFDGDGDGVITYFDTKEGLEKLGFPWWMSFWMAFVINIGLGLTTKSKWYNFMEVRVDNIHLGKHDSDTDIFDEAGEFDEARFDAWFEEVDVDHDGALNSDEFASFHKRNEEDFFSSFFSRLEFFFLFTIAHEKVSGVKVLTKSVLKKFYQGDLFPDIARRNGF